jgi:hypothetical protein
MTYDIYMYIYIKLYYPGGGSPKVKVITDRDD